MPVVVENLRTVNTSIVVPLLNEAASLPQLIEQLQRLSKQCQVIPVDGGSDDGTFEMLKELFPQTIRTTVGRATQMNAGAALAQGEYLLFLHADTILPESFVDQIKDDWGRFDVRFDNDSVVMRVVAFFMNQRSRYTKVATGDQAIFIKKSVFQKIEGFAEIPLMEDVEITKRLRQTFTCHCSRAKVITSARRWQLNGILSTVLLMWKLRLQYFCGVSPEELRQKYADVRKRQR